jgi:hypothetical protein
MKFHQLKPRWTYANVASSIALFAALGGSSYAAVTLPRNSVGTKQLRAGSVTGSEIRDRAIRSGDIRNGGVALKDLSRAARTALRGERGPAGPAGASAISYFLESNSGGGRTVGNGNAAYRGGNEYTVTFPRSVAACALVASPTIIPGGLTDQAPPGSTVIVSHVGDNALVQTYNAQDQPQGLPFSLIAAC